MRRMVGSMNSGIALDGTKGGVITGGVRAVNLVKRKKPEMQKITIRVEVEDEKGKKVSGYKEEQWLAITPIDEVLEKTFEAINGIE